MTTHARLPRVGGRANLQAFGRGCAAILLIAGTAACGAGTPPGIDEDPQLVRESLAAAFRQCTIETGYNPDASAGIPPNQLGPGEEDWRDCAHDAMERVVQPNMKDPAALDALIDEDEALTEAIADGVGSRDARRAALSARLQAIQANEAALYQQAVANMSAAQLLQATTFDTENERFRGDLAVMSRLL
ncbi:MAG: hypothetical protein R3F55_18930 [Alphaproteobacteria bacterium]